MVAGVMLLPYTAVSCTNDYFLDENNCWLYVPEIQKGSIPDFTAVFHGESGNHLITRKVSAPFDKNELMQNGILRFCCNRVHVPHRFCPDRQHANERGIAVGRFLHFRATCTANRARVRPVRSVARPAMPIDALSHRASRFTESTYHRHQRGQLYTGTIVHEFRDLPAQVTRIDIRYTGLSTRLGFNGLFGDESPDDYTLVSYAVGGQRAVTHSFQDMYLPSSGTRLDGAESELTPLKLDVLFYAGRR
ncbi:MAG: hypothetical protein ACLTZY_13010 [Alistipes indistinctus]